MGAFGRPSFLEPPLRDIKRAAQHGDPLRLARVEKANTLSRIRVSRLSEDRSIFSIIDFLAPKRTHAYKCKHGTILKSLRRYDLGLPPILIVEEFLYGEENAIDYAGCSDRLG